MGRALRPINGRQQERQRERDQRRLRLQVRRLETRQTPQRPYRATPNTEGVDPGFVTPDDTTATIRAVEVT